MMRRLRLRVRFWVFIAGVRLMRWGLKNKDLNVEVGRMIQFYDVTGGLDGFEARSCDMMDEASAS